MASNHGHNEGTLIVWFAIVFTLLICAVTLGSYVLNSDIKSINESHNKIEIMRAELMDTVEFTCVHCGYPNKQLVRILMVNDTNARKYLGSEGDKVGLLRKQGLHK